MLSQSEYWVGVGLFGVKKVKLGSKYVYIGSKLVKVGLTTVKVDHGWSFLSQNRFNWCHKGSNLAQSTLTWA